MNQQRRTFLETVSNYSQKDLKVLFQESSDNFVEFIILLCYNLEKAGDKITSKPLLNKLKKYYDKICLLSCPYLEFAKKKKIVQKTNPDFLRILSLIYKECLLPHID